MLSSQQTSSHPPPSPPSFPSSSSCPFFPLLTATLELSVEVKSVGSLLGACTLLYPGPIMQTSVHVCMYVHCMYFVGICT